MGCLEIWDATMCFLYEKKWQDSVEAAVAWAGWITAVLMKSVGRGGQLVCPPLSIAEWQLSMLSMPLHGAGMWAGMAVHIPA